MPSRRKLFDAEAEAARLERTEAEAALVRGLAGEIKSDLAGFDPTRLVGLGPHGLMGLLEALDLTSEGGSAAAPPPSTTVLPATIKGWANRRCGEPSHWLTEVCFASLWGLATALFLFTAISLLS